MIKVLCTWLTACAVLAIYAALDVQPRVMDAVGLAGIGLALSGWHAIYRSSQGLPIEGWFWRKVFDD